MNQQLMTDLLSSIRAMPQVIQAATVYRPCVGRTSRGFLSATDARAYEDGYLQYPACWCPAAARRPRRAGSTPSTRRWTARAFCALNATTGGRPCTPVHVFDNGYLRRPSWSLGCRLECDGSPYSWASHSWIYDIQPGLCLCRRGRPATWWRCRNERRTSRSHRRRVR